MNTLNFKIVGTVISVFLFAIFIALYVNAAQKPQEVKIELTDLVYFQYDTNQEPIPIPEEQLEENMHPEDSNPFSCPNGSGQICSGAYSLSDLEQDSNGDWVPKTGINPTSPRLYN